MMQVVWIGCRAQGVGINPGSEDAMIESVRG